MGCSASMEGPGSKLGVTLNSIGNHHYQQMQTMDNNPNTNGHQNNNQTLGSEMTHPDGTVILSGSSGQHGHGSSEDRNVHNAKDEEKHSKIEAKSSGPPSTETEKDKEHVGVAGDTAKNTQTEETKPPGYKDNKTSDEARQHSTHCETFKMGDTQTSQNRVQSAPAKHKRTNSSEHSTRHGSLIPHAASSLKQNDQNTPESKDQSGGTTDRSELNLSSRSKEAWTENPYEIEDAKRGASTANDPNKGKQASIGDTQTSQNRVQSAPAKHKRTKLPESNTRPGSSIPNAASSLKQNEQNPSESKDLFRGITDRSLPSRSNEAWPENTCESEDANRGASYAKDQNKKKQANSDQNRESGQETSMSENKSSDKKYINKYKDYKKKYKELRSEHEKLKYKMKNSVEENLKLKEELDLEKRKVITDLEEERRRKNEEIVALKIKLIELGNFGEDETALENINIPVRPMTIMDDYHQFRTGVWVDASCDLEEHCTHFKDDESRYRFLCDILRISEIQSVNAYSSAIRDVENKLIEPFVGQKEELEVLKDDKEDAGAKRVDMSSKMLAELKDIFRKHANDCNIHNLAKNIAAEVHFKYKDAQTLHIVDTYIEEAARLTWKMVLQKPPMKFDISHIGREWSKAVEKETGLDLQFDSVPKGQGCKIQFYVFPTLLHGDKIMSKGNVFVGP